MKYMNFLKQSAVVLAIAAISFAGCDKDKEPEKPVVKVTGVKLDRDALSVDFPGEAKLTAAVEPADATNAGVTWKIEPMDVAVIGDKGEVMTLKPGTATITVTTKDGGFTASCALTVTATSSVTTIEASVEDGNTYNAEVDNVKALLEIDEYEDGQWVSTVEIAVGSSAYANGGFTIDLVATVDAKYLNPVFEYGFSADLTVSDPEVMGVSIQEFEAYKAGVRTGEFYHDNYSGSSDENPTEGIDVIYMYVDRDVTITGTELEEIGEDWTVKHTYSESLKKGWNIVYAAWIKEVKTTGTTVSVRTTAVTYTTGSAPEGLKWYYYSGGDYSDYSDYSAKAASSRAAGRKALFGKLK